MAITGYVDADLYGRGFDGIFGYGAEQATRRQALLAFKAIQRFKEKVKANEYIDLDLYGRGDPRIFGKGADVKTRNDARRFMEQAQKQKEEKHLYHPSAVVFPSGIKAIAKRANELVRLASTPNTEAGRKAVELMRSMSRKSTEDKGSASFDISNIRDERTKKEEPATIGEADQTSAQAPNDTEKTNLKEIPRDDITLFASERTIGDLQTQLSTSCGAENTQNKPERVRSRLPSEEIAPHVEKGHVARVLRSLKSYDEEGEHKDFVSMLEQPHEASYSSTLLNGISSPELTSSGSNSQGSSIGEVHETGGPEPISIFQAEEVVARQVFADSDEELQMSFSVARDTLADQNNGNASTSSEEDLRARNPRESPILFDEAGRFNGDDDKIGDLFDGRSGDSGSDYSQHENEFYEVGGPSEVADEKIEGGTALDSSRMEVRDIAHDTDEGANEDYSDGTEETIPQVFIDEHVLGPRNASIINIVETPLLTVDGVIDDSYVDEVHTTTNGKTNDDEEASKAFVQPIPSSHEEHTAEQVFDAGNSTTSTTPSSTDSSVIYEENEGAFEEHSGGNGGSELIVDSDKSGEASSSVVISSSAEAEDSDEIEIEDLAVVEGVEEAEEDVLESEKDSIVYGGDVRQVDSSDTVGTSPDPDSTTGADADEADNEIEGETIVNQDEQTENMSFWQRLGLFGSMMGCGM